MEESDDYTDSDGECEGNDKGCNDLVARIVKKRDKLIDDSVNNLITGTFSLNYPEDWAEHHGYYLGCTTGVQTPELYSCSSWYSIDLDADYSAALVNDMFDYFYKPSHPVLKYGFNTLTGFLPYGGGNIIGGTIGLIEMDHDNYKYNIQRAMLRVQNTTSLSPMQITIFSNTFGSINQEDHSGKAFLYMSKDAKSFNLIINQRDANAILDWITANVNQP